VLLGDVEITTMSIGTVLVVGLALTSTNVLASSNQADPPKMVLAAADNTLGVAVMSAVVGSDGVWARGTIGTSSLKTAGGTYTVQFPRDVSACAYVATLGDTSTALPPTGSALVSRSGSSSSTVFVETLNTAGSLADAPFHLVVFCDQ
jgi:hypothetical protein